MQLVETQSAPAAVGPYSQAVVLKEVGLVYTAGQLGINPATGALPDGIEAQTRQALRNLAAVLTAAGSGLNRVVKTTVFLKSMDDFAHMNGVYAELFGAAKPARSTVEVSRLPKDALVEIEAVAVLGA